MKSLKMINLGLTDYKKTLDFQRKLFKQRHFDEIGDSLIITEHLPIYTYGRSSNPYALIKSKLPSSIKLLEVDRGGSITFHGPGQVMMYPIISLAKTKVLSYLRKLEQVVIGAMAVYGLKTTAKKDTGVWVGEKKLASIGVKISTGISMHGLALNVNCDLDKFKPILACGLKSKPTSMEELLGYEVDIESVIDLLMINFGKTFNYKMKAWGKTENEKLKHEVSH